MTLLLMLYPHPTVFSPRRSSFGSTSTHRYLTAVWREASLSGGTARDDARRESRSLRIPPSQGPYLFCAPTVILGGEPRNRTSLTGLTHYLPNWKGHQHQRGIISGEGPTQPSKADYVQNVRPPQQCNGKESNSRLPSRCAERRDTARHTLRLALLQ